MSVRFAFLLVVTALSVGCQPNDSASSDDAGLVAEIGAHVRRQLGDQRVAYSTRVYCGDVEPCEVGSHAPDEVATLFAEQLNVSPSSELPDDLLRSSAPPDVVVSLSPIEWLGPTEATVLIRYARPGEIVVTRLHLTRVQSEWQAGEEVIVSGT